jgi:transposase
MAHQHKRGTPRTQTALLPASIEDYVQAGTVVRLIDEFVGALNMVRLGFEKSVPARTGRPAYAPDDLLRLYLYGYWQRVRSSRRLELECQRNVEVMWLLGELRPDHKTIAQFRRDNGGALGAVCAQFVQFLREVKLVGGEALVVAVDGSKFKACASKKSVPTLEQLKKERKRIERRIADYLADMDEADREEEGEAAPTKEQIEAAIQKLRERSKKLEQTQDRIEAQQPGDETARVSLSDPDCVLLSVKGAGVLAGYNVQHAVDTQHHLIVAHEVTTLGNDHTSLEPMASAAQQVLQAKAMTAVADCGYMNGAQAQACEQRGITPVVPMAEPAHTRAADCYPKTRFSYDAASDTYRCPADAMLKRYKRDRAKQTDYYWTFACAGCAQKALCTTAKRRSIARSWWAEAAERAAQRARERPRLMRLRSASAEHPFGNLKAMLPGGFSVRSLPKVRGEMALAVLTYNLKRAANILGSSKLQSHLQAAGAFASA